MRAIIQPIALLIALLLQLFFGIELAEGQIEVITSGFVAVVLAVTTVVSYIESKKEKEK